MSLIYITTRAAMNNICVIATQNKAWRNTLFLIEVVIVVSPCNYTNPIKLLVLIQIETTIMPNH